MKLDGGHVFTICLFIDWVTDVAAIWCWDNPSLIGYMLLDDFYLVLANSCEKAQRVGLDD